MQTYLIFLLSQCATAANASLPFVASFLFLNLLARLFMIHVDGWGDRDCRRVRMVSKYAKLNALLRLPFAQLPVDKRVQLQIMRLNLSLYLDALIVTIIRTTILLCNQIIINLLAWLCQCRPDWFNNSLLFKLFWYELVKHFCLICRQRVRVRSKVLSDRVI